MKKGEKVLINSSLCSSCTSNETFEFCDSVNDCNQLRIKDLDITDLEEDVIVKLDDYSQTHETENHRILEYYEFIKLKDYKTNEIQTTNPQTGKRAS